MAQGAADNFPAFTLNFIFDNIKKFFTAVPVLLSLFFFMTSRYGYRCKVCAAWSVRGAVTAPLAHRGAARSRPVRRDRIFIFSILLPIFSVGQAKCRCGMSIRLRIILGFLLTTVVLAAGIMINAAFSLRQEAESSYQTAAQRQLRLMAVYVTSFLQTAERNAALLAQDQDVASAGDAFPTYKNVAVKSLFRHADLSWTARRVLEKFTRLDKGYADYAEVYAGYLDGNYASSIDNAEVAPGFDMTKRPWYVARKASPDVYGISESYRSYTGEMVFAVTHKMFDADGNFTGVLGVDVSLAGLSARFKELNFGQTGYFMLIEHTGRILSDPKHPDAAGNIIGQDIKDPGLEALQQAKDGMVAVSVGGIPMLATLRTTEYGWKIAALQAKDEIFAATYRDIRNMGLISAAITILALGLSLLIVRSINRPLDRLVGMAHQVAGGDLSVQLDGAGFYGELAALRQALAEMVQNLKNMLQTAEQKSGEAEEQTRLAKAATEEAEQARQAAERARRDGMLTAAGHLEEVVAVISAAAQQLATRIEQSDTATGASAQRLAEAATAMNEMNATVQEVAKNASDASQVSAEARARAASGADIVGQALSSIDQVQAVSLELKEDMTRLDAHAQSISRIMGVISDIADQTNLLALNAAIEAARAGEAGRGFAVVADEVRKLAEKTMTATKDVGSAIQAIQESADKSVVGMDNALKEVQTATGFASQSGEALQQIVSHVEAAADQVRAIAAASEEQSSASEEINQSIVQVNAIAAQTTEAMHQAAAAVTHLTEQAQRLQELINEMQQS